MARKSPRLFKSFEDFALAYEDGRFDTDDITDLKDPILLDWCARLTDWAPAVAVLFNREASAVTIDRIAQHEMPELRRLACMHPSCSIQTLQRMALDSDKDVQTTAEEFLQKQEAGWGAKQRNGKRAFA